jgi:hypothetical protein
MESFESSSQLAAGNPASGVKAPLIAGHLWHG